MEHIWKEEFPTGCINRTRPSYFPLVSGELTVLESPDELWAKNMGKRETNRFMVETDAVVARNTSDFCTYNY